MPTYYLNTNPTTTANNSVYYNTSSSSSRIFTTPCEVVYTPMRVDLAVTNSTSHVVSYEWDEATNSYSLRILDEQQQIAWRQENANEEERRLEADLRAETLLLENLSEKQRKQYRKFGSFIVHGQNNMRYRIRKGCVANVDAVKEDGTIKHRLCFHPEGSMPDYDVMLAQKLLLEAHEDECLRVANIHPSYQTGIALPPLH